MKRILFTILGILFILKVDAQTESKEKVRIYLGWSHQFQFAGYYAAKELGFYDSLGYDVELIPGRSPDNVKGLLDGNYDYAIITAASIISDPRNKELKVLAAFFQQSPVTLITLRSRKINTLKDLEGGKVNGRTEISTMLKSAGVDLGKVDISGDPVDMSELLSGKFDGMSYYITDKIRLLGADSILFKTFRPIEYGVYFYGECLVTSKIEFEENEDRVREIRQASIDGWEYAVSNKDEIVELIFDKYNSGLTRAEIRNEADITIQSLIQPYFHDIGDMQNSKWSRMVNVIDMLGIYDVDVNLEELIYDPNSGLDSGSKRLLLISGITIGVALLIMILLSLYSRQLKKAVNERTESLQKTNAELDRFVYSVSHDIKSPLSSIQGIINLMKLDPSRQEKYIEMIQSSVQQLEKFTSEILDYSRNSRSEVVIKPVNINELLDNTISELKYLNNSGGVRFEKKVAVDEPINTDEWRLKIVLSNIISNAVKYSDNSKDDCFVKIDANRKNGSLQIDVVDNGIGIEDHHLDKIYDMFYRATEESKGSGLGLYIVNETMQVLNGEIDIESEPLIGTHIRLRIPNLDAKQIRKK